MNTTNTLAHQRAHTHRSVPPSAGMTFRLSARPDRLGSHDDTPDPRSQSEILRISYVRVYACVKLICAGERNRYRKYAVFKNFFHCGNSFSRRRDVCHLPFHLSSLVFATARPEERTDLKFGWSEPKSPRDPARCTAPRVMLVASDESPKHEAVSHVGEMIHWMDELPIWPRQNDGRLAEVCCTQ